MSYQPPNAIQGNFGNYTFEEPAPMLNVQGNGQNMNYNGYQNNGYNQNYGAHGGNYQTYQIPPKKKSNCMCCCKLACCMFCLVLLVVIGGGLCYYFIWDNQGDDIRATDGSYTLTNLVYYSNTSSIDSPDNNYFICNVQDDNTMGLIQSITETPLLINSSVIISSMSVANTIISSNSATEDIFYSYTSIPGNVFEMVESINLNTTYFESQESSENLELTASMEPVENYISLESIPVYKCQGGDLSDEEFIILVNTSDISTYNIQYGSLLYSSSSSGFIEEITSLQSGESASVIYTQYQTNCNDITLSYYNDESLLYPGCSSYTGKEGVLPFTDSTVVSSLNVNDNIIGRPSGSFSGYVTGINNNSNGFSVITCSIKNTTESSKSVAIKSLKSQDAQHCNTLEVASYLGGFTTLSIPLCYSWGLHPSLTWIKDPSTDKHELTFDLSGEMEISMNIVAEWGTSISVDSGNIKLFSTPPYKFWVPDSPVFGEVTASFELSASGSADFGGSVSTGISASTSLDTGFTYEFPTDFDGTFTGTAPHTTSQPLQYSVGCTSDIELTIHVILDVVLDVCELSLDAKPSISFSGISPGSGCSCDEQTKLSLDGGLDGIDYTAGIAHIHWLPDLSGTVTHTTYMEKIEDECVDAGASLTQVCGTKYQQCLNPVEPNCTGGGVYGLGCECYQDTDGNNYLAQNQWCDEAVHCSANSDCSEDEICATNTCCGGGFTICLTYCSPCQY